MTSRSAIALTSAVAGLFVFLLLIAFGDRGLADMNLMRSQRDRMAAANRDLMMANWELFHEKQRLETDPAYIAHVAREELGLVAAHELVFIGTPLGAVDSPETPPSP
jgi:cell division protein FtsB